MLIRVYHSVPYDKGYEDQCVYNDGDFWGRSVCVYHKFRNITHCRKAPIERNVPKCTLFGDRLDGYNKCKECLIRCRAEKEAMME
jgi:hypothetical protein